MKKDAVGNEIKVGDIVSCTNPYTMKYLYLAEIERFTVKYVWVKYLDESIHDYAGKCKRFYGQVILYKKAEI